MSENVSWWWIPFSFLFGAAIMGFVLGVISNSKIKRLP